MGMCRPSAKTKPPMAVVEPRKNVVKPSTKIVKPMATDVNDFNTTKVSDVVMLERLEGGLMTESEDDGLAIMFEANSDIESKLTGTLRTHLPAWKHIGAGAFTLSVIENGYIPKLGAMPTFYAKPNNKSYRENVDFVNDAVMKLLRVGVIEEVARSSLGCVNPLTVAQNTAKKHLCIDLSRCFNEQCDAQSFKIESTAQALASIHPDNYIFNFDLKSAYLQVLVNTNFWPYLGFAIQDPTKSDVSERHFWYKMLPFELNDTTRVLTKLMHSPIKHWRVPGISVFLHIDDGFSFANSRDLVLCNYAAVIIDLMALVLLISEGKCSWGECKVLEWTGFVWDTVCFRLAVTDRKIEKAAALFSELSSLTGKVAIR